MTTKICAWQAQDGSIHLSEDDARQHDFCVTFNRWFVESGLDALHTNLTTKAIILRDRRKLAAIFALLGGDRRPTPKEMKPTGDSDFEHLGEMMERAGRHL